ncbi:SUZ RNA-binding domain-containing-like [Hoplias malabaricus]|uniref:SUZ RNA-binding domain-containing-like n=1 Tax=Hoplias malabaricus TaxID=27720 RepID=UPI0034631B6F
MEDDDVSDNWEDAAESGEIERRLEAKLKISQKSNVQHFPVRTAMVIQDDSLPAAPPPQIRILKRPQSNDALGTQLTSRPALQVKSLAQREAEYAEARRRILGSAEEPSQEQSDTDRSARALLVPESQRPNNHIIRQPLGPDGTTGFRLSR